MQKTGQLKVRPERLGHNGLASCRKSGGQVGRGTTCCLPTCVRSLSTTLQSAKNTKLNYRDRDWAIGPLHLLPMVFKMRLVCSPNITLHLLGTREMQDMCFFALFVFNCCRHNRCHWCCDCNDRSLTDILPPTLPATHNKIFLTC